MWYRHQCESALSSQNLSCLRVFCLLKSSVLEELQWLQKSLRIRGNESSIWAVFSAGKMTQNGLSQKCMKMTGFSGAWLSLSGVICCYSWCVPVSCYQLGAFVYEFEIEVFFRTYDLSYFKSNNTLYVPLGFYFFIPLNFYLWLPHHLRCVKFLVLQRENFCPWAIIYWWVKGLEKNPGILTRLPSSILLPRPVFY